LPAPISSSRYRVISAIIPNMCAEPQTGAPTPAKSRAAGAFVVNLQRAQDASVVSEGMLFDIGYPAWRPARAGSARVGCAEWLRVG